MKEHNCGFDDRMIWLQPETSRGSWESGGQMGRIVAGVKEQSRTDGNDTEYMKTEKAD